MSCTATMRPAACFASIAVGAHRYAADQRTEVLCCAYAVDDEPVQLWTPGDPVPPEFIEAAADPPGSCARTMMHFETAIEQHILAPRFGWPVIPLERHRCTMAVALAAGIAGAVERSSRCARARQPQRCRRRAADASDVEAAAAA